MEPAFTRIVVAGASRGIGAAVAAHYAPRARELFTLARTPCASGRWLRTDFTSRTEIDQAAARVGPAPLDALLVTGGTWETRAFTDAYRFDRCSDEDLLRVITVNLLAPIRLVQAFLPALRAAPNPKIIVIGAAGVRSREVANSASKAGLHGMVAALREELRDDRVGITLLNPGNVATPEVLADVERGDFAADSVMPMSDLLAAMDALLALSRSSAPAVLELPAMGTRGA